MYCVAHIFAVGGFVSLGRILRKINESKNRKNVLRKQKQIKEQEECTVWRIYLLWNHRIGAFVSLGGILRAAAATCQKANKPPQCITTQNIKYKNSQIQNSQIQNTFNTNRQIKSANPKFKLYQQLCAFPGDKYM